MVNDRLQLLSFAFYDLKVHYFFYESSVFFAVDRLNSLNSTIDYLVSELTSLEFQSIYPLVMSFDVAIYTWNILDEEVVVSDVDLDDVEEAEANCWKHEASQ